MPPPRLACSELTTRYTGPCPCRATSPHETAAPARSANPMSCFMLCICVIAVYAFVIRGVMKIRSSEFVSLMVSRLNNQLRNGSRLRPGVFAVARSSWLL